MWGGGCGKKFLLEVLPLAVLWFSNASSSSCCFDWWDVNQILPRHRILGLTSGAALRAAALQPSPSLPFRSVSPSAADRRKDLHAVLHPPPQAAILRDSPGGERVQAPRCLRLAPSPERVRAGGGGVQAAEGEGDTRGCPGGFACLLVGKSLSGSDSS